MLDFSLIHTGQLSVKQFVERENISPSAFPRLTNEMVDRMLELIADCDDADVSFVPDDPNAEDTYAENPDDVSLAWTLGHVIVHTTASAEESAFLAAELARGVEWHGRSRYEVAWETVTMIAQCRARLQESRRMRLATLDVWPQLPHLENTYEPNPGITHDCLSRFVAGLMHDDAHLGQIQNVVAQAQRARRKPRIFARTSRDESSLIFEI
ncbi:MAG: DinB family protein [Chloroflexi bacterium]|nr:DinB family protein [Chloroflexota bacterium]